MQLQVPFSGEHRYFSYAQKNTSNVLYSRHNMWLCMQYDQMWGQRVFFLSLLIQMSLQVFHDNHYLYIFAPDNDCRQRWVRALKEGERVKTFAAACLWTLGCTQSTLQLLWFCPMQRQNITIWWRNTTQTSGWMGNGDVANKRRNWRRAVTYTTHWAVVCIIFFSLFQMHFQPLWNVESRFF